MEKNMDIDEATPASSSASAVGPAVSDKISVHQYQQMQALKLQQQVQQQQLSQQQVPQPVPMTDAQRLCNYKLKKCEIADV